MSLLDTGREVVTVYLEEEYIDGDGNRAVRASDTGIVTKARMSPAAQSGTSARNAESNHEGFTTEQYYRLRFPRSFRYVLGPRARIQWNGQLWGVFGHPMEYNGSRNTAHYEYMVRRS